MAKKNCLDKDTTIPGTECTTPPNTIDCPSTSTSSTPDQLDAIEQSSTDINFQDAIYIYAGCDGVYYRDKDIYGIQCRIFYHKYFNEEFSVFDLYYAESTNVCVLVPGEIGQYDQTLPILTIDKNARIIDYGQNSKILEYNLIQMPFNAIPINIEELEHRTSLEKFEYNSQKDNLDLNVMAQWSKLAKNMIIAFYKTSKMEYNSKKYDNIVNSLITMTIDKRSVSDLSKIHRQNKNNKFDLMPMSSYLNASNDIILTTTYDFGYTNWLHYSNICSRPRITNSIQVHDIVKSPNVLKYRNVLTSSLMFKHNRNLPKNTQNIVSNKGDIKSNIILSFVKLLQISNLELSPSTKKNKVSHETDFDQFCSMELMVVCARESDFTLECLCNIFSYLSHSDLVNFFSVNVSSYLLASQEKVKILGYLLSKDSICKQWCLNGEYSNFDLGWIGDFHKIKITYDIFGKYLENVKKSIDYIHISPVLTNNYCNDYQADDNKSEQILQQDELHYEKELEQNLDNLQISNNLYTLEKIDFQSADNYDLDTNIYNPMQIEYFGENDSTEPKLYIDTHKDFKEFFQEYIEQGTASKVESSLSQETMKMKIECNSKMMEEGYLSHDIMSILCNDNARYPEEYECFIPLQKEGFSLPYCIPLGVTSYYDYGKKRIGYCIDIVTEIRDAIKKQFRHPLIRGYELMYDSLSKKLEYRITELFGIRLSPKTETSKQPHEKCKMVIFYPDVKNLTSVKTLTYVGKIQRKLKNTCVHCVLEGCSIYEDVAKEYIQARADGASKDELLNKCRQLENDMGEIVEKMKCSIREVKSRAQIFKYDTEEFRRSVINLIEEESMNLHSKTRRGSEKKISDYTVLNTSVVVKRGTQNCTTISHSRTSSGRPTKRQTGKWIRNKKKSVQ